MNATASTRTHSLGQQSIVFAAILALLSWSFVVVTPLTADAEHEVEKTGPQLEALVAPTFLAGNPTCGDFYATTEFKVEGDVSSDEDVQSGTYHFDEDGDFLSYEPGSTPQTDDDAHFSVHIDVYELEDDTWEGPVFDFQVLTDHGIRGVVAKGGEVANLYDYGGVDQTHAPTSEADGFTVTADETLHSPHNRDNRFFGVSHISFCPEEPPAEPDVHELSVTKTVDGDALGEGDEFEFVLYPTDAEGDPVVEEGVTQTVTAEDDTATWTDLEDGEYLLCETGLEEGWSIGWPEGLTVESVTVEDDTFECVVVVVDGEDVSFTVDNIPPDEAVEPAGIIADITKTNDADGDGEFSDEEVAEDEGDAVDFELEIFNDNPVDVIVVELTDSYGDVVIDLLAGEVLEGEATLANNTCAGLDGATIPASDSVTCTFTLEGYAPAEGEDVTNVASVELEDPETGETAEADDTSNVGTVEEAVLPAVVEEEVLADEEVLAEELPATGFDALQALFAALLALSLGGVTLLGLRLHELRGRMYGTA